MGTFFRRIVFISLAVSAVFCFAQQNKIDSLKKVITITKEDTNKVNALNKLSFMLSMNKGDTALSLAKQSLQLATSLNFKMGISKAYNNIGLVNYYKGNYTEALDNYLKSLKLREQIGDKRSIAASLANIGNVYLYQQNYDQSLNYFSRALKITDELGDNKGSSSNFLGKGNVYYRQNNFVLALDCYLKAVNILEQAGIKNADAGILNNIGSIYNEMENYPKALQYFQKCFEAQAASGDEHGIATCSINIANLYNNQNNFPKALEYYNRSLSLAEKIGNKDIIKVSYSGLADVYSKMKDFKNAFYFERLHLEIKDSLVNEDVNRQVAEMQTKYDTEKKQQQIQGMKKDKKIAELKLSQQQTQLNNQRTIITAGIVLLLVLVAFSYFMYKSYHEKQKTNLIIEEKNKEITDSINYAKKIQEAMLPAKEIKYKLFPDAFVLFLPRDIVSGDFYWFGGTGSKRIIAAVDCTGHGVPGAFMSMIGNAFLNEIIYEKGFTKPSEILDMLREFTIKSLKQEEGESKSRDGMDIAICVFDDLKQTVDFAGANNPLYFIREKNLSEIKPDKQPIGIFLGEHQSFTNHSIEWKKGDCFYIFSDGYSDQFGGPEGKKFKNKQLKETLLKIHEQPMLNQEINLLEIHHNWKGNVAQIDDILVIGVRV